LSLRAENGLLRERCLAFEKKQAAITRKVDVLGEEVVDLRQKMTNLTLDLEEKRSY